MPETDNNIGALLAKTGRTDESSVHYQRALEINPNNISSITNLANAFAQKRQLADAVPLLERAFTLAKSAGDEARAKIIAGNLEMLHNKSPSFQKGPR